MKKVELKTITAPKIKVAEFHGDKIEGVKVIVGGKPKVYLLFRRLCENLGLSYGYQTIKLKKLAEEFGEGCVSVIKTHDTIGREQEQLAIELDFLPTYLLTIDTNRVKPEIREKLRLYKREAKEVLARYFLDEQNGSKEARELIATARKEAEVSKEEVKEVKPAFSLLEVERVRARTFRSCALLINALTRAGLPADEIQRIAKSLTAEILGIKDIQLSIELSTFLKSKPEIAPSKLKGAVISFGQYLAKNLPEKCRAGKIAKNVNGEIRQVNAYKPECHRKIEELYQKWLKEKGKKYLREPAETTARRSF